MSCCRPDTNTTARRWRRWGSAVGAAALLALFLWDWASAGVYHSRESALRLAFPSSDSVATRQVILEAEQAERIERRAGAAVPSRLVNVYVGEDEDGRPRYAYFDTHRVRTLPETLMVVVGADGEVEGVHLLAFHEPPSYQASEKWLAQFEDRHLDREMAVDRGIAGIGGATLTANAVTAAVRRILATHDVAVARDLTTGLTADSSSSR